MILEIKKYPDPVLRKRCQPVKVFDEKLKKLCVEMFEVMDAEQGIGLAAPQVGQSFYFFIVNFQGKEMVFINPEITKKEEVEIFEEGCLSFPGLFIKVKRPKKIELKFQNIDGQEKNIQADGLLARVIQHELDHLNGILFIDRLPWLKRISIIKKLKKSRA